MFTKNRRSLIVSLFAVAPFIGLAWSPCAVSGQSQLGIGTPAPTPAQSDPALAEAKVELQKAQIQSALAERIAQAKEDIRRAKKEAAQTGQADDASVLDAEADAAESRANADIAKVNVQILDLQIRSGLITPPAPPQGTQGGGAGYTPGSVQPGAAPQAPNPAIIQVFQLELKRAHIQSGVTALLVQIRQKQYDLAKSLQAAGHLTQEKLTDAMLDLESAKAAAQIAPLDEGLMVMQLQQAGGRP